MNGLYAADGGYTEEPIRVAHIIGKMVNGGIESVVMNYYRHIDRSKIQFDFLVDEDIPENAEFKVMPIEEIESLGGRVYMIPPYQQLHRYIPALIQLFRKNNYQIVHSHINTLSVFPLYAAKKAGVPVRIAHSHSTAAKGEYKKNIFKYCLRPFSKLYATNYAACSEVAGRWLFGNRAMKRGEVTIFRNAIDLEKFKFDQSVRDEMRKELGVADKFVIGHVGRFCYQKNQTFLLEVYEQVYKKNPNAVLLLIGDGEDREIIEEKINQMRGRVILCGNQNEMYKFYMAMDAFVFPSRYEGLGLAAVEAQLCGRKTIVSNAVPLEAVLAPSTVVLEVAAGPEIWAANVIGDIKIKQIEYEVKQMYDIRFQAQKLDRYYMRCICHEQNGFIRQGCKNNPPGKQG